MFIFSFANLCIPLRFFSPGVALPARNKFETRNSKQFQMIKIGKILNKLASDSMLWIFSIGGLFIVSEFVSDFDIRISDFVERK